MGKLCFVGLLANTDSSILKIKFGHGFKIGYLLEDKGVKFISTLENLPYNYVHSKLYFDFSCLNLSEKKIYYISNDFDAKYNIGDKNDVVKNYLFPKLKLMRLFKEGNICMPVGYYYIGKNIPKLEMTISSNFKMTQHWKYTLEKSEIADLQRFIRNTKLPFVKSFLQIAFENFEFSYKVTNINLSFLSLMNALECLFNPGRSELKYRISRNVAVLLGDNNKGRGNNSQNIFIDIKKLYDKRSKIVHSGKLHIIEEKDLLQLRDYVRQSIKEIDKIGKDKEDLLCMLNSCGFDHKPWRKKKVGKMRFKI